MKQSKKTNKVKRLGIGLLLVSLLVVNMQTLPVEAAVPRLDTIRAALFLKLPGKYEHITSFATLSSEGGLQIGERTPSGTANWLSVPANEEVRFGLDDFKVKVFETTDLNAAQSAYQYLSSKGSPVLLAKPSSKPTYQIREGSYASAAEATTAVARWSADAQLQSLTKKFKPVAAGPYHLESAAYGNEAVAYKAAQAYGDAGVDTFIALRSNGKGGAQYSVVAGAATSEADLKAVQSTVQKLPGGSDLKPMAKGSYYLKLAEYGSTGKSEKIHLTLAVSNMAAWVSPAKSDKYIKLNERSNRIYRGAFELSSFNGKLAVVNEVPLEQYLYSVVAVEMYSGWPEEALKAQAVAARTFALQKGLGYQFQVAHVVDTTLSQVYNGVGAEAERSTAAVKATAGEVILHKGKLIEALYSASAGGMTADATEAWNSEIAYLKPIKSPDEISEAGLYSWYKVALINGKTGYIREDLLKDTGKKTSAGGSILELTTDNTNVRKNPLIQDNIPAVAQLNKGVQVIGIEKTIQSNAMHWTRGSFSAAEIISAINAKVNTKITSALQSIEVSKRGPSGRVLEITANGQKITVASPDNFRSMFNMQGSLPSTLFDIEEEGKVVMAGAKDARRTKTNSSQAIHAISANGTTVKAEFPSLYIMDSSGQVRAASKEASYRFTGTGYGHGVGMSQYGAYALAEQGYDHISILKYYYKDVTIEKD